MENDKHYLFLKNFVDLSGYVKISEQNNFESLTEQDIVLAERCLNLKFPKQLRQFYLEIGCGNLTTPENPPIDYRFMAENEILHPSSIVKIMLLGHDSGLISQDVLDFLQPGDMPFFHIADSCLFLIMKPLSKKPNAVYNQFGDLIEENFSQFIWRLYFESPCYYENI
jgi:hypothetical protein